MLRTNVEYGFLGAYNQDRGVPPFERFYVGGDGMSGVGMMNVGRELISLRGYSNNSLSPQTGATVFSKYTADSDSKKVPTYLEALQSRKQKYIWPDLLGEDIDPIVSLSKLEIPGLWIFGSQDGSVPVDLSIARLQILKDAGGKYEYVVYPGLGHNNMQETFDTAIDWIKRLR